MDTNPTAGIPVAKIRTRCHTYAFGSYWTAAAYGPYVRSGRGRGGGRTVLAQAQGRTEEEARERLAGRLDR